MNKPFKQIFVQLQNGIMVPINELPKESYEYFLELTHQVRLAYIAITDSRQETTPQQSQQQQPPLKA